MKIAIDFDGTISKYPKLIKLGESLISSGNEVFILTAGAGELPEDKRKAEMEKRLAALGSFMTVVWVHGHKKSEYCLENNVDFLIDDEEKYCVGTIQLYVK